MTTLDRYLISTGLVTHNLARVHNFPALTFLAFQGNGCPCILRIAPIIASCTWCCSWTDAYTNIVNYLQCNHWARSCTWHGTSHNTPNLPRSLDLLRQGRSWGGRWSIELWQQRPQVSLILPFLLGWRGVAARRCHFIWK